MPSLTYYLTASVIKLKGLKKTFSESPINYARLRKDDVHHPTKKHTLGLPFRTFAVGQASITEITPNEVSNPDVAILYCPGGAFVYGPTEINWHSIATLVKQTRLRAYLVDYPKAPENQIEAINRSIDEVYAHLLGQYEARNIILIGDSVGATLLTLLVQRLLQQPTRELPNSLILVSPVADASLSNPAIAAVDRQDIMLSVPGALSAKRMCAGDLDLCSPDISPLYGTFQGFIPTQIFIAERDIMRPDAELLAEKLRNAGAPLRVVRGAGMPHIWPFLPVMREAKQALNHIAQTITENAQASPVKTAEATR
ncbi:alpha/beta hydrolase [Hymenobacter koreensis]|uniref:Alpha/beta hydrolase fold-3 domain-containing protein n=1 Tax=Hymenobacter koreensis TaxID=1084523 RepID=A0ABP8IYL8_9BACT